MQRQQFLYLLGLSVLPFRLLAANRQPTPPQTEGPFYPVVSIPLRSSLIRDEKNLVGEVMQLDGRILDRQNNPLAGAKIEIWQCDGNGRYAHPAQDGYQRFDPGFEGFGAQRTNHRGEYHFTTLYPVPYPGRPAPHPRQDMAGQPGAVDDTALSTGEYRRGLVQVPAGTVAD